MAAEPYPMGPPADVASLTEGLPPVNLGFWLLATLPVVLLATLVATGRAKTWVSGVIALAAGAGVGSLAFGADTTLLGVALGKGLWTALWILYVIWPALLVYRLCEHMGITRIGEVLTAILPTRVENILVVAWVFPSLVQGVAGFATPVAVAAPLLVSMGVRPVLAVALPLIGYHWSVGFGSMGSSFYMGAFTSRLGTREVEQYAASASLLLGVAAILSGALVAFMYERWTGVRRSLRLLVVVGPLMALTQALTVRLEPAIGALCAGFAGVLGVALVRLLPAARNGEAARAPGWRRGALVLLPYALLLVLVLPVFLPPPLREWVRSHLLLAPSFPGTSTSRGLINPATPEYTPIALVGHPGSYLLGTAAVSWLVWRLLRRWPTGGGCRAVLGGWVRQAVRASPGVIALTCLATVMADTGMVGMIAVGMAEVTGPVYPTLAPLVGMLGSFTTGSTTSSNALFAGLQGDVARLLDRQPADLVAAQLAGGNVGNSLAPVVLLVGTTAIGEHEQGGPVLRRVLLPAALLAASAMALTTAVVLVHS